VAAAGSGLEILSAAAFQQAAGWIEQLAKPIRLLRVSSLTVRASWEFDVKMFRTAIFMMT
jgi:hypothetical protein